MAVSKVGDKKINTEAWTDALNTAIMLTDLHMKAVNAILLNEDVREDLRKVDNWKGPATSPLQLACALGRTETVQKIIDAGANVKAYASGLGSWMTPLHQTALSGHVDVAKMLVRAGADPDDRGFQDALKGTPLDFAKHAGHKDMVSYLESIGGSTDRAPTYAPPKTESSKAGRRKSVGSAAATSRR